MAAWGRRGHRWTQSAEGSIAMDEAGPRGMTMDHTQLDVMARRVHQIVLDGGDLETVLVELLHEPKLAPADLSSLEAICEERSSRANSSWARTASIFRAARTTGLFRNDARAS